MQLKFHSMPNNKLNGSVYHDCEVTNLAAARMFLAHVASQLPPPQNMLFETSVCMPARWTQTSSCLSSHVTNDNQGVLLLDNPDKMEPSNVVNTDSYEVQRCSCWTSQGQRKHAGEGVTHMGPKLAHHP